MSYASMAAKEIPTLSEDQISWVLVSAPKGIFVPNLLQHVKKNAGVHPVGIKPNHQGLLLAFGSNAPREALLKNPTPSFGKMVVTLSQWPVSSTKPADRGRRWRMENVPFHLSAKQIIEALLPLEVTEVKLETLKGYPDVRTPYANFWLKDQNAKPPRSVKVGNSKMRIFDPSRKENPSPPKEKVSSKEPSPPSKEETPLPPPPRSTASSPPDEVMLIAPPNTPAPEGSKKRFSSPLSHSPPKKAQKTLTERKAPTIDEEYLRKAGLDFPQGPAILSIYEEVLGEKIQPIADMCPISPGGTKKTIKKLAREDGPSEDIFSHAKLTGQNMERIWEIMERWDLPVDDETIERKGWAQYITYKDCVVLVLFRSRIANYLQEKKIPILPPLH